MAANSLEIKMLYWCKSEQSCILHFISDGLKSYIASCLILSYTKKHHISQLAPGLAFVVAVILPLLVFLGWLGTAEKPDPKL